VTRTRSRGRTFWACGWRSFGILVEFGQQIVLHLRESLCIPGCDLCGCLGLSRCFFRFANRAICFLGKKCAIALGLRIPLGHGSCDAGILCSRICVLRLLEVGGSGPPRAMRREPLRYLLPQCEWLERSLICDIGFLCGLSLSLGAHDPLKNLKPAQGEIRLASIEWW